MKTLKLLSGVLLVAQGAFGQISIGGGTDPYAGKPAVEFQVAGQAAEELLSLQTAGAPYRCQRRDFPNPGGGTIRNTECTVRAVVVSVRPVTWWPKDQVGMGELNIAGPTVNYLIRLGAHSTPLHTNLEAIRCSENAFAPGTGTCALLMDNID